MTDEPKHTYPSRHPKGSFWATDAGWEILDAIKPGLIPDDVRAYLAEAIAGRLMRQCSAEIGDEELAAWARNWRWNVCVDDKPVDPSIYFRDMRMLKAYIAKANAAVVTTPAQPSPAATVETKFDGELVNGQCKIGDYCQCCAGKPKMCPNYEGPGAHNSSSADEAIAQAYAEASVAIGRRGTEECSLADQIRHLIKQTLNEPQAAPVTRDTIAKAICCPNGCVRDDDCLADERREQREAVDAIMSALSRPEHKP